MSDLHVTTLGDGDPVVFVHGSFVRGGASWHAQRPLADRYRLLLVDRRGYGGSPPADGGEDFERDAADIAELLGDGAHLVGSSYGAVVSLLAAGQRIEAVRSLTIIEPPAFGYAPASAAARAMQARVAAVLALAVDFEPEEFFPRFLEAMGYDLETLRLTDWAQAAIGPRSPSVAEMRTSMYQRLPWEAALPLDALAAALFPKLAITGGWDTATERTRSSTGAALRDVSADIARRIGAEEAVIPGALHTPHSGRPAAFNARLRAFLDAASGGGPAGGEPAGDASTCPSGATPRTRTAAARRSRRSSRSS